MSQTRRRVLATRTIAGLLPAGVCETAVVQDVTREVERLLAGDTAGSLRLLVFLSPAEIPNLLSLETGAELPRWAAVLIDPASAEDADPPRDPRILAYRATGPTAGELRHLIQQGWDTLEKWTQDSTAAALRAEEYTETAADLDSLVRIGQALSQEKDPEKLLRTILSTCKKITGADAGSISLVEPDGGGGQQLRFKYSHTFSKELAAFEEQVMPVETRSLAGYVAVTGQVINIPDVYALDGSLPYRFNESFDRKFGYRTRSMLAVPMRNHVDEVIGVIQLINCKESTHPVTGNEAFEVRLLTPEDFRDRVVAFPPRYESLMQAVASQAAIALENSRLVARIRSQFEQFVRASVAAIESRDPPTSGHSFRVTQMSVNLARAVNRVTQGPLAAIEFPEHTLRELELAGLLHDFGKVYIEPAVFLKARRLYPSDHDYLMLRLEYLYRCMELDHMRKITGEAAPDPAEIARLQAVLWIRDMVRKLNEPGVLPGRVDLIRDILDRHEDLGTRDLEGRPVPILTDTESENLAITTGTLNQAERKIIESHVTYTSAFVEKIPWPPEFAQIPRITRQHHERMDGSGYPDGLKGSQITPQARIMAIADVYDALTAADRPYKPAVPSGRVLQILRQDAAAGKLDADLVELFITERAYIVDDQGGEV